MVSGTTDELAARAGETENGVINRSELGNSTLTGARRLAALCGVTAMLATTLSIATVVSVAQPVAGCGGNLPAHRPGDRRCTQRGSEDVPSLTPEYKLTATAGYPGYVGASGQLYTADAPWLTGCNGYIASAAQDQALAHAPDCRL